MSELVNKDLDAALSKNYPRSSALSRVTPGPPCLFSGEDLGGIQEQGKFPHLFGTLSQNRLFPWGLRLDCRITESQNMDQLQEPQPFQPRPLCPHCHLPHVPNIMVATSSSKDTISSPREPHPGHHLRSEVSVSVVLPLLGI